MKIDELQCDQCGKRVQAGVFTIPNWYRVTNITGLVEYQCSFDAAPFEAHFCSTWCASQWFSERVKEND